jgi:hypothetical protein
MDAQIPLLIIDRKEFRVMSTHYRTCGVTRLRITNLLSTRMVGSTRELHRKSFGKIENVSVKKIPEMFRNALQAANLDSPACTQPHGVGRTTHLA